MCPVQPFGYAEQPHPFVWRTKRHDKAGKFVPLKLAAEMIGVPEHRPNRLPTLFAPLSERERASAVRGHYVFSLNGGDARGQYRSHRRVSLLRGGR
jgi:hypothetical protein